MDRSPPRRDRSRSRTPRRQLQRDIETNGLFAIKTAQPPAPVLLASTSATLPWIAPQDEPSAAGRVGLAGRIGEDGTSTWIGPLVRGAHASDAVVTGGYALSLLDADGATLGTSRLDVRTSTHGPATGVFRASVPWSDQARSLVVSKGDTVLARRERSAHAPDLKITSPTLAQRASGEMTVAWTATDADGDGVTATVLYSRDGGADGWSTLALWLDASTFTVDTSRLEPGPNPTFRVVVSDGFDETDAQVSVRIDGRLDVLATFPATDTPAGPDSDIQLLFNSSAIQLLFNSDVAPESLERARVRLRPDATAGTAEIAGAIAYDARTRVLTVTPATPLAAGVRYDATLDGGLVNRFGHPLAAPVTWSVLLGAE